MYAWYGTTKVINIYQIEIVCIHDDPVHIVDSCSITRSFLTIPELELYKREAMWGQDRFVSIYLPEGYRYRYRFGTGENVEKKGTILSFECKHEWTNCISRYCKVSLLVVHHLAFYGLEPLSRQKSASQEDSYINTFAGFSYVQRCICCVHLHCYSEKDSIWSRSGHVHLTASHLLSLTVFEGWNFACDRQLPHAAWTSQQHPNQENMGKHWKGGRW